MTKHVCFIGDSHIAALKLASKSDALPGIRKRMSTFGARGLGLMKLVARDNMLTSDDPDLRGSLMFTGRAEYIDLDAYDMFCVVGGCRLSHISANEVCASHTSYRLGLSNRQLVSNALLDLMLIDRFRQSLAAEVVSLLAGAMDKPIYLIPDPFYSAAAVDSERGAVLAEVLALGHQQMFADWIAANLREAFAGKATVLEQPADTVVDSCLTIPAYGVGSIRLARRVIEHPATDFVHMNGDYGQRVLQAFFDHTGGEIGLETRLS